MALSNQRILMQRGQLRLIESSNPALGVSYAVSKGSLGIWRGQSLVEAERRFRAAVRSESVQAAFKPQSAL